MDQETDSEELAVVADEVELTQTGEPLDSIEGAARITDAEAEPTTTHRWEQQRCYGFRVGRYQLLVTHGSYCELLTRYQVAALPNAPDHFLGLTNVRGNLVPVYQLEPLLSGERESRTYALVIGNLSNGAALTIARKPVQFDLADLLPVETAEDLPEFLRSSITGSYTDGGELWSTIDHEQLFQYLADAP